MVPLCRGFSRFSGHAPPIEKRLKLLLGYAPACPTAEGDTNEVPVAQPTSDRLHIHL